MSPFTQMFTVSFKLPTVRNIRIDFARTFEIYFAVIFNLDTVHNLKITSDQTLSMVSEKQRSSRISFRIAAQIKVVLGVKLWYAWFVVLVQLGLQFGDNWKLISRHYKIENICRERKHYSCQQQNTDAVMNHMLTVWIRRLGFAVPTCLVHLHDAVPASTHNRNWKQQWLCMLLFVLHYFCITMLHPLLNLYHEKYVCSSFRDCSVTPCASTNTCTKKHTPEPLAPRTHTLATMSSVESRHARWRPFSFWIQL